MRLIAGIITIYSKSVPCKINGIMLFNCVLMCMQHVLTQLVKYLWPVLSDDGISARMLKSTACSIAPSLTKLFNLSLQVNTILLARKKALVPVPKNTGLTDPANYRPISLLPIVSKLLERHVYGILMDHLRLHHPFATSYSMGLPRWAFHCDCFTQLN